MKLDWMGVSDKKAYNVNLAFMECFTSCVLTYVHLTGRDYTKVILDYWNLRYQFKTLLSSKDARQLPLQYLYGIRMKFVKGSKQTLLDHLRQGTSVIYLCMASRLAYFPRSYLGMEAGGFQHSVLLLGCTGPSERILFMDPMADYAGQADIEELTQAGGLNVKRGELHYFTLEESAPGFVEPPANACLSFSAERNLSFYCDTGEPLAAVPPSSTGAKDASRHTAWIEWFGNRHGGWKALDRFAEDLAASPSWTPELREGWVKRNTMTISSIRRLRSLIWDTIQDMAPFSEEQRNNGQEQVERIAGLWQALNYQLIKFNSRPSADGCLSSITRHIDGLKSAEVSFLQWVKDTLGKEAGHGSAH